MPSLSPNAAKAIGQYLQTQIGLAFARKGHNLTGEFVRSIEYRIRSYANGLTLDFFAAHYGQYLNTGIPASRIPYTPGARTGAKTSEFIAGLIRYAHRRMGLRGREAVGAAFGMATNLSRRGLKGSAWLDELIEADNEGLAALIEEWAGRELELLISNYVQKAAA